MEIVATDDPSDPSQPAVPGGRLAGCEAEIDAVAAKPAHRFVLPCLGRHAAASSRQAEDIVGLDFEFGNGDRVKAARRLGLDFWGAESYYRDAELEDRVRANTSDESVPHIKYVEHDRLPIPDATFDFVCSTRVLEHVHDLGQVLLELRRLMKPGGVQIHIFPTREIVTEAHTWIPSLHRFPDGHLRRLWAAAWHHFGLGKYREDTPFDAWYDRSNTFLNHHTVYRTFPEIERLLRSTFPNVRPLDKAKLMHHLTCRKGLVSHLTRFPVALLPAHLASRLLRRVGSPAFELSTRRTPR